MVNYMDHKRQPGMEGPFKGHLAPKSSAFKPTVNKLSTQYLIQDHMANHVNKILNAKCAIDAKPPKSYEKSVIKRDQVRRKMIEQQLQEDLYKADTGRNEYDDHFMNSRSLRSALYDDMRSSTSSVSLSKYYKNQLSNRPATANTLGYDRSSKRSPNQLDKTNETADTRRKTYEGGDYLDRHKERFKNQENAPFTPRTKINKKGKSKLVDSRHYAPPLKLTKPTKRIVSTSVNLYHSDTLNSDSDDDGKVNATSRLSTRNIAEDENLQKDVEKLNLSSLSERSRQSSRSPTIRKDEMFAPNTSVYTRFRRSSAERRALEKQLEEEELETKYLQFVNEVANEILTRGVYSDRVIIQTMERHIDRHRGELDDFRMRQLLLKLQQDLGIRVNYDYQSYQRELSNNRLSDNFTFGNKKATQNTNSYTKTIPKPTKRTSRTNSVRSSSDADAPKPARKTSSILVSDSDAASDVGGKVKLTSTKSRKKSSSNENIPKSASIQSITSVESKGSFEEVLVNNTVTDTTRKSPNTPSSEAEYSKLDEKNLNKEQSTLVHEDEDSSVHEKLDDLAISDARSHFSETKDEEIISDDEDF